MGDTRHILLIHRRMIPSIRLCGHCQAEFLASEGKIAYRAAADRSLKAGDLQWADIALLGRLDSWYELQLTKKLKAAGKTLVYILDDDLLNVPEEITSAGYYNQPEIRKCIGEIIALSDAILSPSPLLLEKYAVDGRKGILIEEPAIDPVPYVPHDPEKPVKIGFAGSVDRMGDLEGILAEALKTVKKEYGDRVAFEFFGAAPSFAGELGAACVPYTRSYDAYRKTLDRLAWDIGLAPMPDTPFHACKHYNKFTEYAAAGVAGVYSNTAPYDRLQAFPGCAVLCGNTAAEWTPAIRSLLEDRERLEETRRNCSACAAGPLSVRSSAEALLEALEAMEIKGKEAAGSVRTGSLLPYKTVNVWKRFLSSLRGHGAAGFVKHALSLLRSSEKA